MSGMAGPERRGPERPGPDYPPEWDDEPNDECTCPSGDGSLRWPCPTHPPVTAVDRPDNGQDEGRQRIKRGAALALATFEAGYAAGLASGRAGAGEQQREVADRAVRAQFLQVLTDHVEQYERTHRPWGDGWKLVGCICGWRGTVLSNHVADELLALLGAPQPDGEARQHHMDADCWCQPVQADNGAWDHQ